MLLNTIKIIQQRLNNNLIIEGLLLTMYDTRLRLSNQVVEEVKTHFQDMVLKQSFTEMSDWENLHHLEKQL